MKKFIGRFIASIRQKLLHRSIHAEIEHKIFPQLCGKKQCEYPFSDSTEGLDKFATFGALDARLHLDIIERRACQLPETYAQAFRYVAYRDINARLKMYEEFVRARTLRMPIPVVPQGQPST